MRRSALAALVAAGLLAGGLTACSESDGRALPPPDPQATTTTSSSVPSIQPPTGAAAAFTLRSTSFSEGGVIPDTLTCAGAALSPDLAWTGIPFDAASLAIIVRDRNDGGLVHWVVSGIDAFVQGIGQGGLPENAVEGRNGEGSVGWLPPCPAAGTGVHTYEFALLALPGVVELPPDATAEQAAALLEASAGERAVLTGTVAS